MLLVEELEALVEAYYERLWQNADIKNHGLELSPHLFIYPRHELVAALSKLTLRRRDAFGRFALAKHSLALSFKTGCASDVSALIPFWLGSCVDAGAYTDCIHYAEECARSSSWYGNMESGQQLSVLRSLARALRNTGQLSKALYRYREIVTMADDLNDPAEGYIALLLIGKLYGNYWGQLSLFSSFVDEAKAGLERELSNFQGTEDENKRLVRGIAICHDALGQAYRHSEPTKVEWHFQEAIRLNEQIARGSGISRALCHLNYFRYKRSSPNDRATHLEGFAEGMKLLSGDQPDERGMGIRFIQYALMLNGVGRSEDAKEYLSSGRRFAARYSEYKTLARAAIVESNLYKAESPERAVCALKNGLSIAREYKLPMQESEINLCLAEFADSEIDSETQLGELFTRNRLIFMQLINEVKDSLAKLDGSAKLPTEFEHLSLQTKQTFREKLLLDFDHTVSQLYRNIDALMVALRVTERRRQRLLVFEVVNTIARLLLHDYNNVILGDAKVAPLNDAAIVLNGLGDRLAEVQTLVNSTVENIAIRKVIDSLLDEAEKLRALGKEQRELQKLLSERLRRPQHLEDKVSLRTAIGRAITELQQEDSSVKDLVVFDSACDVVVTSNYDIMVTVIQNLIRNALDEVRRNDISDERIIVYLGYESKGDPAVHKAAILSVVTRVADRQQARRLREQIENGLRGYTSTKMFGSGVGLDIAQLVLVELMGSTIQSIDDNNGTGLKVSFKTGLLSAEIIFGDGGVT